MKEEPLSLQFEHLVCLYMNAQDNNFSNIICFSSVPFLVCLKQPGTLNDNKKALHACAHVHTCTQTHQKMAPY